MDRDFLLLYYDCYQHEEAYSCKGKKRTVNGLKVIKGSGRRHFSHSAPRRPTKTDVILTENRKHSEIYNMDGAQENQPGRLHQWIVLTEFNRGSEGNRTDTTVSRKVTYFIRALASARHFLSMMSF